MTVLLEYLDLSISVAGHSKDLEGPALPLATPLKKRHGVRRSLTKFRDLHLYKYAYYACTMLEACLLCQHYA